MGGDVLRAETAGVVINDRDAIAALFEADKARLVLTAQLIVSGRSDAEDVVADALGYLLARADRLPVGDGLRPYVFKSVINRARTSARRRRVHAEIPDDLPMTGALTEDEVVRFHEYRAVLLAVRTLPRRQMSVVLLRYWQNLSIDEVAACLGISSGAVKSHGARALRSLKKSLEGAGYGPLD